MWLHVTGSHKVLALHMQCELCNEAFYHRVKLITNIKTEHGVNVGKKYMQHEHFNEKLV